MHLDQYRPNTNTTRSTHDLIKTGYYAETTIIASLLLIKLAEMYQHLRRYLTTLQYWWKPHQSDSSPAVPLPDSHVGQEETLRPSANTSSKAGNPYRRKPNQGWGLQSQFPPFRYFPNFSPLSTQTSNVRYRVYIWQVSSQLSCDDTCQIWMWYLTCTFARSKILLTEKLTSRALVTPTPGPADSI